MSAQAQTVREMTRLATKDYKPSSTTPWGLTNVRQPLLPEAWIPDMLRDPTVSYGLRLMKGPILADGKVLVEADTPEVDSFVTETFDYFMSHCAYAALSGLEWGFSGAEVVTEFSPESWMRVARLRHLNARDLRVWGKDGEVSQVRVRGAEGRTLYLRPPKIFWWVNEPDHREWYGRSILQGAFPPWLELYGHGGLRDSRQLYWHKYAFDGGVMYYPATDTAPDELGSYASNRDLALELMDKRANGASIVLPDTLSTDGTQPAWRLLPPNVPPPPAGLMEEAQERKREILLGMGVPPELADANGVGSFAGRRIPQQGFYASLQRVFTSLVQSFDTQIVRWLVRFNFGPRADYQVKPEELMRGELEGEGPEATANVPGAETAPTASGGKENPNG